MNELDPAIKRQMRLFQAYEKANPGINMYEILEKAKRWNMPLNQAHKLINPTAKPLLNKDNFGAVTGDISAQGAEEAYLEENKKYLEERSKTPRQSFKVGGFNGRFGRENEFSSKLEDFFQAREAEKAEESE